MIIENPDVFKSWLTSILEPLCDADPAALAKYVYALVKKDKPVEELRDVMVDQLDVFLQAETKPFVEMLFKSLESNEYLQPREAEKPPTPPPEPEPETADAEADIPATNGATVGPPRGERVSPPAGPGGRHRVVVPRGPKHAPPHHPPRVPLMEQTLVKVLPLTELLEEPVDQLPRRRDRRGDSLREDRRRRRSRSAERRMRPRRHPLHDDNRRRLSRSPSPRGRYRNRSPPPVDRLSRSRSRSPVPLPRDLDRERDRLRPPRELERDRMSRDRDHRERVSRSRDRDRSRERSRDRSRGSASPRPEDRLELPNTFKRRCRDFDEKGYCMRGDQCQWDHGNDPVVLEDNALTRVLAMPPPVPEYNPLVPDIWMGGPPGFAPFPPPHLPPPRELIHIPRVRHEAPVSGGMPPVMPPRHAAPPHKKNFDYNRLGPQRPPPPMSAANCSLEVKKVPRGMNDITHLNNHFCKFGKIVNIQICFGGDPEAALVTFSSPAEASVAYKSTEAVLNNRFIKVFWHNPDSKQENMAPGGQNQTKPMERNPAHHTGTHHKVLINRDNIKATADIKQNNIEKEKEKQANGQEAKKAPAAAAPAPVDKSKRARELLDTQLHQQRRLIQKLESGNLTAPQKNAIMDAIKSTQEGIEKLQKELVSYQGTISMKMQVKAKKPKTREEAQKEILDAELDLFTKQQEGQDVTDLLKKIEELRRNMAIQFPVHTPAIRRPHPRGGKFNPALRFTRGAGRQYPGSASVDHRPRALLISGFETDELETLYTHFAQYGEVSSKEVDLAVPQLVLQYKVRAHAEQAMLHGKHYNDRTLSITWVTNQKPAASPSPAPERTQNGETSTQEQKEEPSQSLSTDALLRFEEEEEEEREDRSWRR